MQINTLLRKMPFSARFFAGTMAVVIAGAVLVMGFTVIGYEKSETLSQHLGRDFQALRTMSDASARLAKVHIDVQALLEQAGQSFDEEAVYTGGSAAFQSIDAVIAELERIINEGTTDRSSSYGEIYGAARTILDRVRDYRRTLVSAIEMTSVDLGLARTELVLAAQSFNSTIVELSRLIGIFQEHLDQEIRGSIVDIGRALLWWGVPAGLIVVIVLLFSWLMTATLSKDLGQILASMRRLGAGDTDAPMPDLQGDREFLPIVDSLNVFRSALVDLKRSHAILEEKVRERTRELEMSVGDLKREVARRTESEGKLNVVLESMDQGIYAVGPDLAISLMNRRFADLYGLPPELRRPGAKFEDMARFNAGKGRFGAGEVEEHVGKRMQLARENRAFTYELNLPDGRVVDTRSNPLPGGGFVRTATDITERREMETQLRQAQKMQSLGNLAGGLAHEINNLLLPIMALAKMTQKQFPEGSRDAVRLGKIVEASERAKALVAQVMAFGRQDEPKMENVDIFKIVRETMELIYKTLLSTITISKHLDEATGTVWADAAQIGAVVINLVNNAQDSFGGKSGTVNVTLGPVKVDDALAKTVEGLRTGPYAKLTVVDGGKGMDDETLRRVFDPFFTTKEVGTGTGLGMSMVYGIIKRHEGAINLASAPSVGTTVDIYLPLIVHKQPA